MARYLFQSVFLLVVVNLLVKPVWIFGVDRNMQVFTGYEAYGIYFSYFSFTIIFNIVADAGITLFVQQRLAAQQQAIGWFRKALGYKFLLSAAYALFAFVVGWLLGLRDLLLLSGLVLLQVLLSWIAFTRAVLSAQQRFTASTLLSVLDKLFLIIPAMWLFYVVDNGRVLTIHMFAWWQVLSAAVTLFIGFLLLYYYHNTGGGVVKAQLGFREIVSGSFPFALVVLLMFLHARADGVLLHLLSPDGQQQAGQYAAMYRFVDGATVLSYLAAGFLLSFWSRHLHQQQVIRETLDQFFRLMLGGAAFICVLFFFYSRDLQQWLYHSSDAAAASVLQWGMLVLVPYFLVDLFGTLLTANKKLKVIIFVALSCALINILLNVLFIPVYGARAAAIIAIFTQGLFAGGLLFACARLWKAVPSFASVRSIGLLFLLLTVSALALQQVTIPPLAQIGLLFLVWVLLVFLLRLFSLRWFLNWESTA